VISPDNLKLVREGLAQLAKQLSDPMVQIELLDGGISIHLFDEVHGPIFIVRVNLELHDETKRYLASSLEGIVK
jgi:hypothetical protein